MIYDTRYPAGALDICPCCGVGELYGIRTGGDSDVTELYCQHCLTCVYLTDDMALPVEEYTIEEGDLCGLDRESYWQFDPTLRPKREDGDDE